ncbi:hypothetical protein LIA77_04745 [Sarocladium implicatum]|nr:hypothetical protein LIA77_04745 [Sarocladium implicatum]
MEFEEAKRWQLAAGTIHLTSCFLRQPRKICGCGCPLQLPVEMLSPSLQDTKGQSPQAAIAFQEWEYLLSPPHHWSWETPRCGDYYRGSRVKTITVTIVGPSSTPHDPHAPPHCPALDVLTCWQGAEPADVGSLQTLVIGGTVAGVRRTPWEMMSYPLLQPVDRACCLCRLACAIACIQLPLMCLRQNGNGQTYRCLFASCSLAPRSPL